jgi:hypothetical protein
MFFGGIDFVFAAIGISIVARAIRGGGRSRRFDGPDPRYAALPQPAADPRVPQLLAEVEELRAQVERLQDAQSFYAQLSAPAPGSGSASPPASAPAPERPAAAYPPVSTGPRTG